MQNLNEIEEKRLLMGQNTLVTGSNRGIGREIITVFASEGANVFAHARKEDSEHIQYCKELEKKYCVQVVPVYFDANNENQIKECVSYITKITRKIDVLVNNIGFISDINLFQMTKMENVRKEFEVNFFSQLYLTQLISRLMIKEKKGSIVNISSCAGIDGNTGMVSYVSEKAAIIGATKRLAIELGEYNIRVNSIAPGLTETAMGSKMRPDLEEKTIAHQIFKRKAKPREVANAVLFFSSDLAGFITGQTLRVDGGMLN